MVPVQAAYDPCFSVASCWTDTSVKTTGARMTTMFCVKYLYCHHQNPMNAKYPNAQRQEQLSTLKTHEPKTSSSTTVDVHFDKYHYGRIPRRPTPKTITEPEITPSTRSTRTAKFVFRHLRNRQLPRRYENNYRRPSKTPWTSSFSPCP